MKTIPYATRYATTMTQEEEALSAKNYGKNATPILIPDKSIEGLLAANCPKKEPRSMLKAYRFFVP
jgi:hypothetical protein